MKAIAKYISYLALGALAVSCADDGLADKGNTMPERDTPYFVNLRLVTETGNFTRAEELGSSFVDGEHNEHAISPKAHNFALFFDEDENYISYADLYSVNEKPTASTGSTENEEGTGNGDEATGNGDEEGTGNDDKAKGNEHGREDDPVPVEATYSCRFYGFANRKPKYVLVVANANNKIYDQITKFPGWDIDEVMKQVWEEQGSMTYESSQGEPHYEDDPYDNLGFCKIKENEVDESGKPVIGVDGNPTMKTTKYFTMTNSSYIRDNRDNKALPYCAEEIPDDCIATNEKEFKELTENNKSVKIYLERMVSKFSFDLSFDQSKYIPTTAHALDVCTYRGGEFTYTESPWGIEVLAWGLNGLETQSYVFKNLDPQGHWLKHIGWNSPANRRSYWSIDPHYFYDVVTNKPYYPWQYDDAKNKYNMEHPAWYYAFNSYDESNAKQGAERKKFALTYYPFTRFCSVNPDGTIDENKYDGSAIIYTPENTFDPGIQLDPTRGTRAYELAGTHLLVAARLLVGSDYRPVEGHIYRNRVGVTYFDEVSMFEDFMNAMNFKLTSQEYIYYRYYPWDDKATSDFHKDKEAREKNDDNILDGFGGYYDEDLRAHSKGYHAVYYQNPENKRYYELTSDLLYQMMKGETNDGMEYRLWRDADALNADGKVIPWIMYRDKGSSDPFQPCNLYILRRAEEKDNPTIDPVTKGEVIADFKDISSARHLTFEYRKKVTAADGKVDYEWTEFPDLENDRNWENNRDNNDIQSLFFEIWGVADDYNHGLMYYAVPIYAQQYNETPAVGSKRELEDKTAEIDDISFYYYYGVVRNNWYKFTLHSIGDLGVPVSDPNKPIVPNYMNKKDQVKVEMEVLPMHVQDIDVPM